MAKKRGTKGLDVQIKELEAAITEAQTCPACWKAVEPDAVTCPYCGAVFGEGADLQVEAAKSLQDLEKHLEAAVEVPPETPQPPKVPTPGARAWGPGHRRGGRGGGRARGDTRAGGPGGARPGVRARGGGGPGPREIGRA